MIWAEQRGVVRPPYPELKGMLVPRKMWFGLRDVPAHDQGERAYRLMWAAAEDKGDLGSRIIFVRPLVNHSETVTGYGLYIVDLRDPHQLNALIGESQRLDTLIRDAKGNRDRGAIKEIPQYLDRLATVTYG